MNSAMTAETPVKFRIRDTFHQYVRARAERYFRMTKRSPHGGVRMIVKTLTILLWLSASYALLLFFSHGLLLALLGSVSLGMAVAAVGFNVQHDAGHKAYFKSRRLNRCMAFMLDLMGASSYLWNIKHNKLHHTYTNIEGHDDDINLGVLGRLSPHQPRYWFHRYQHIYLWFLYAFIAIKWQFYDDFHDVIVASIGKHSIDRPRGRELVALIGGKIFFFTFAFVIPCLLHSPWVVIGCYLLAMGLAGVIMSTVFQLAHVVEVAASPLPTNAKGDMAEMWGIHQMQTTVDFAQKNWVITWYVGGLNFQAEHHLLPQVSHVHYPKIARLVANACERFNVAYNVHPTLFAGIASHARQLQMLGRPLSVA